MKGYSYSTWRKRLNPSKVFTAWMITYFVLIILGSATPFKVPLILLFLITMGVLWLCWYKVGESEFMVRLWARITGLMPVKLLIFDHRVMYTLVEEGESNTWAGALRFTHGSGHVTLHANGYVDPECESSYCCYIWHPLDPELTTSLQLAHWDQWPSWESWKQKDHVDMALARREIFSKS